MVKITKNKKRTKADQECIIFTGDKEAKIFHKDNSTGLLISTFKIDNLDSSFCIIDKIFDSNIDITFEF